MMMMMHRTKLRYTHRIYQRIDAPHLHPTKYTLTSKVLTCAHVRIVLSNEPDCQLRHDWPVRCSCPVTVLTHLCIQPWWETERELSLSSQCPNSCYSWHLCRTSTECREGSWPHLKGWMLNKVFLDTET